MRVIVDILPGPDGRQSLSVKVDDGETYRGKEVTWLADRRLLVAET